MFPVQPKSELDTFDTLFAQAEHSANYSLRNTPALAPTLPIHFNADT